MGREMSTKQQRQTARRKARQLAALADLERRAPQACYALTPLGGRLKIEPRHIPMLPEKAKRRLVEGFNRGWR
jgi:hypothetical protein